MMVSNGLFQPKLHYVFHDSHIGVAWSIYLVILNLIILIILGDQYKLYEAVLCIMFSIPLSHCIFLVQTPNTLLKILYLSSLPGV
jgi:hypothetical protein